MKTNKSFTIHYGDREGKFLHSTTLCNYTGKTYDTEKKAKAMAEPGEVWDVTIHEDEEENS